MTSFVSRSTERKIEKVNAPEVPPPGLPVTTAISAEPICVIRLAAIVADSCALLTKVVGRAVPFQLTVELGAKLEPLTVKVKAPLLSSALCGEMDERTGVRL
jgi:hypothetical protein